MAPDFFSKLVKPTPHSPGGSGSRENTTASPSPSGTYTSTTPYLNAIYAKLCQCQYLHEAVDIKEEIPVTGFAVATRSNKRNADFDELSIPEGTISLKLSIPNHEITALGKETTAFIIHNAIQITTRQAKYTFTSFLSRSTTYDIIANIWRLARLEDTSADTFASSSGHMISPSSTSDISGPVTMSEGKEAAPVTRANKVTHCACSKNGEHLNEIALETVLPGIPDKIYNLMFGKRFIKDFMRVDKKLMDVQISDWINDNSKLLARNMSYIKPLNNNVVPKHTKCEIHDEALTRDFDDHVVMLTMMRTPDVPSGGVFSVETKTCTMWASAISTRSRLGEVSPEVTYAHTHAMQGLIEKSAIDYRKVYYSDLNKAMRMYIQDHQSESIPAGIDTLGHCACSKNGEHLDEIVLETVLPEMPDKIYHLMFASGFIEDFMHWQVDQNLMAVQISDWTPIGDDSKRLAQHMSYIEPLNNARPRVLREGEDMYNAGKRNFHESDRHCVGGIDWEQFHRKCAVLYSSRSLMLMIWCHTQGLIEKSAISGQRVYHFDLGKAMRMYIQELQSQFTPAGIDPTAAALVEPLSPLVELNSPTLDRSTLGHCACSKNGEHLNETLSMTQ
ncbi:uncharacterized protein EDB91DRAFT_1082686 [Suillus paluster]|uniref:uncharacterized protein n=1 Tax=Suillus paluster TaxID=48578 RepID=UPI001B872E84|nr:uncharacterized protein EDB91DRAFT_1082686 [Suillus paluster]KAG1738653.1 hypothetical protein EDB91DRAFT_1082686 [Suillus paluster]